MSPACSVCSRFFPYVSNSDPSIDLREGQTSVKKRYLVQDTQLEKVSTSSFFGFTMANVLLMPLYLSQTNEILQIITIMIWKFYLKGF